MRRTLKTLGLTLLLLAALDGLAAAGLRWAEHTGRLGSLVQYFEYGRSVPGKLDRWEDKPGIPGNLFDVAWRADVVENSAEQFRENLSSSTPTIRSYGMSFVDRIMTAAVAQRPGLLWDSHSGPTAPPNYTYALFEDDRDNRRPRDIVVFGILSSGLPAMAALSNRSWLFEQPAPMTYPVYWPHEEGLHRVEPILETSAQQRDLAHTPTLRAAWHAQLAKDDAFFSLKTFGWTWADASPFARLVRRSLAKSHIDAVSTRLLRTQDYPYAETLRRMVYSFASTARADGQTPVVMLIQSSDPRDADIHAITAPVLEANNILYFATADHFDPRDRRGFVSDGHYRPEIDTLFAERLLELLQKTGNLPAQ